MQYIDSAVWRGVGDNRPNNVMNYCYHYPLHAGILSDEPQYFFLHFIHAFAKIYLRDDKPVVRLVA